MSAKHDTARHIFLTGEIQVGKSTSIRQFLAETGVLADGFTSRVIPANGRRELYISQFDSRRGMPERRLAATVGHPGARAFLDVFDGYGTDIINSSGKYGLVIMDELGSLEENALSFKAAVIEKLNGPVRVLGVIKKTESAFLDSVRKRADVAIITVTPENRDDLPAALRGIFT
ncbi:MAG: nucleoside-triphosphatase [Oscillospiraceae bacterium]|jgi:nucleoside-triphosphatase|nr:nucleoside-triphosphatase [Oscillospiraceae bacterium]